MKTGLGETWHRRAWTGEAWQARQRRISAPGRDGVPCGMDATTDERGWTPYTRPGVF